jgi:CDGSH-type Zn-finger protein
LPGDVIATVTEPVYDTATGKFLLIPQGSRILGKYNSQVSYGQSRVQVVWNRIILPDTSSLTLDNLVGTDPAGYAGLEDDVDWHWNRIVAGAVLTTLLGVGAELAAPENRQDGNRIVIAGRDSAQDSINQVGQEITRRNMNIQPTLTSGRACRCGSSSTGIWCCGRTSRCSSTGELRNEHDQEAAARAAAQDRERQADLCLPGQPESRPRPLRRAARAGVWRGGRCRDS